MLTNLGIFLDCVGCIGTFYRSGVIERIELAPPGHIELPDGSVGWKYEKHWLIKAFCALVEYQIGQIVGEEIYTGVDGQGKHCFTNYKTQQVRKI
jgi:hypothetical protein